VNPPRWRVAPPPPRGFSLSTDCPGAPSSPLFDRVLFNRGLRGPHAARAFLQPRVEDLSDPLELPGMEAAVERLAKAAAEAEPVGLFGDFDVDGLAGTAAMALTLRSFGMTPSPHIPRREREGHGLSVDAVERFRQQGLRLIVTVDNGATAHEAVARARALGIDTIVTDHHMSDEEPPPAIAVVNPHLGPRGRAWDGLSGAGVAFKLAQALHAHMDRPLPRCLIALAGLGTLADAVPLRGDNRVLARECLLELALTDHPGLRSLVAHCRSRGSTGPLDSETVAFQVSPRLNAPGRMGDPAPALSILLTDDPAEAEVLAGRLDVINAERRRLSNEAREGAEAQLRAAGDLLPQLLVVRSDGMPSGLLGPLAGRLCAEYNRPAVACALREGQAQASARSIPQFDIYSALLPHAALLARFGGHARAAGFSVPEEHLDEVLSSLQEQARWALAGIDTEPLIEADAEPGFDQLDETLFDCIERMEPFGEANAAPIFITRGALPLRIKVVGSGGRHLRLTLEQNGRMMDAIGFNLGRTDLGPGAVDVAYSLRTDFWAGRKRRQLGLLDIRPAMG